MCFLLLFLAFDFIVDTAAAAADEIQKEQHIIEIPRSK